MVLVHTSLMTSANYYDGGEVLSVDIKQENVDYANKFTSERTSVYCSDSAKFLWDLILEQD